MRRRSLVAVAVAGLTFGGLFFVATHLFLRSRERALLLRACYDAAGQDDLSEIRGDYVEAPEIVLAALNVPQCVAYVRAVNRVRWITISLPCAWPSQSRLCSTYSTNELSSNSCAPRK